MPSRLLQSALLATLVTCLASGCGGTNGRPDGGNDGGPPDAGNLIPLGFDSFYNLTAFVDVGGGNTNVAHIRVGAQGGAPTDAGFTWSVTLDAGIPSTVTIDPKTGVMSGTLPSTFVPGPPGVQAGPGQYAYALTVTVSDGNRSYTSNPGDIRLFISQCNSNALPGSCSAFGPPDPYGAPLLAGGLSTSAAPFDIIYNLNVAGVHVGEPFGYTLPLVGGTGPYAFAVDAGTLPPGLSLSASTGTLWGTPATAAAGNTYAFTATVTDKNGNQGVGYFVMGAPPYSFVP